MQQIELANLFGDLLKTDSRFEIVTKIRMGLVCFRLKGSNKLNETLIDSINHSRLIFLTKTIVNGQFIIRFAVCARTTTEEDIRYSWGVIQKFATTTLTKLSPCANCEAPCANGSARK